MEVLAPLHAVPLIRRVGLRHEVRHAGGHLGKSAAHFAADLGDRFRHVDDAVEIDLPLAGQAAHEIQLHFVEAVGERCAAAFEQIFDS